IGCRELGTPERIDPETKLLLAALVGACIRRAIAQKPLRPPVAPHVPLDGPSFTLIQWARRLALHRDYPGTRDSPVAAGEAQVAVWAAPRRVPSRLVLEEHPLVFAGADRAEVVACRACHAGVYASLLLELHVGRADA